MTNHFFNAVGHDQHCLSLILSFAYTPRSTLSYVCSAFHLAFVELPQIRPRRRILAFLKNAMKVKEFSQHHIQTVSLMLGAKLAAFNLKYAFLDIEEDMKVPLLTSRIIYTDHAVIPHPDFACQRLLCELEIPIHSHEDKWFRVMHCGERVAESSRTLTSSAICVRVDDEQTLKWINWERPTIQQNQWLAVIRLTAHSDLHYSASITPTGYLFLGYICGSPLVVKTDSAIKLLLTLVAQGSFPVLNQMQVSFVDVPDVELPGWFWRGADPPPPDVTQFVQTIEADLAEVPETYYTTTLRTCLQACRIVPIQSTKDDGFWHMAFTAACPVPAELPFHVRDVIRVNSLGSKVHAFSFQVRGQNGHIDFKVTVGYNMKGQDSELAEINSCTIGVTGISNNYGLQPLPVTMQRALDSGSEFTLVVYWDPFQKGQWMRRRFKAKERGVTRHACKIISWTLGVTWNWHSIEMYIFAIVRGLSNSEIILELAEDENQDDYDDGGCSSDDQDSDYQHTSDEDDQGSGAIGRLGRAWRRLAAKPASATGEAASKSLDMYPIHLPNPAVAPNSGAQVEPTVEENAKNGDALEEMLADLMDGELPARPSPEAAVEGKTEPDQEEPEAKKRKKGD
eukprot:TRINITY_DN104280_c0_g1_i1.p1 TRINITY_DN104280_c0_g1~~TRINITY_DN104280_c0_g1_i1.p1  ORF type:complete len:643 (-),score=12.29 TRINITY_DN104280_c0_g1_i1:39-1907(-)